MGTAARHITLVYLPVGSAVKVPVFDNGRTEHPSDPSTGALLGAEGGERGERGERRMLPAPAQEHKVRFRNWVLVSSALSSHSSKMKDRNMELRLPSEKRARVIVNTDAKNEADDQFAIVHALLTPSFEIHGIIPAHFGTRRFTSSMQESRAEVIHLLDLMHWSGRVRNEDGAPCALSDDSTPVPSPGASLIIEEALREDPRPLHVAFYGPLTDMASALLLDPAIQERDVRVVWIGGGPWPDGGHEFNLSNDIHAANVVMRSKVDVWQIPSTV